MTIKLSNWINRVSKGWVALSSLVIFLLFTGLVLPGQASQAEGGSGEAGSPDLSFFYSADDLYRMAEAYGDEGRRAFVRARFTFDLIWPIVYTIFLTTAISWVTNMTFRFDSPWQRANLAPVIGALFDYLENVSTSFVMIRYPSETAVVDMLAGAFTTVKWVFVGSSFVLLLVIVIVAIWRRVRGKANE